VCVGVRACLYLVVSVCACDFGANVEEACVGI